MSAQIRIPIVLSLMLVCCMNVPAIAQPTVTLTGTVSDSLSGDALPGANIFIKGTAIGTASDGEGRFRLGRVPIGNQTLVVSFIGYRRIERSLSLAAGEQLTLNIALQFEAVAGREVVVTAQLEGQAQAINQQLSANTIVNVVSSEKIQELPDQNAAESLGRLPGISVQRNAGEGQKIIVRGLSPRFNSVTINGERIPATGSGGAINVDEPRARDDRSVDLSMISPEMLAGIEVYKSLTPDRDADAIGGSVNFSIRRAPRGRRIHTRLQSGYNDHEEAFGQFKGSASLSDRYMNEKLGLLFTGNIQRADRSSELLDAGYGFSREDQTGQGIVQVFNLNLGDRIETRDRFGSSLALDYDLGSGEMLLNTFWSRTNRDEVRRRRRYRVNTGRQEYDLRDREINTTLISNSFSGQYGLPQLDLRWRASYSRTEEDMPYSHNARFRELAAFTRDLIDDQGPELIPLGAKNNLDETFFKESAFDSSNVFDRDFTAQFDAEMPFVAGNWLAGKLKTGGKLRDKQRERDNARYWTESFNINNLGAASATGEFILTDERKVAIANFVDPATLPGGFLDGAYTYGPFLDRDKVNAFGRDYRDFAFSDGGRLYVRNPVVDVEDYKAGESISAGYVMSEMHIKQTLMLLAGVRFERTTNDYQSIFGNPFVNDDGEPNLGSLVDTTGSQTYSEWLPMFHLRVKPQGWVDLRLAATRSLSRPDYFNLVPWQRIVRFENDIDQGNPNLKHTTAWNYDAYLSFYNRFGLFTAGLFYKKLWDVDYLSSKRIIGGEFNGYNLTEPVNAPEPSIAKGWELEVQTNLKFLPSPFDGIVLYGNYSQITSETFYPLFDVEIRNLTVPPFFEIVVTDTIRAGRLAGQADRLANLTIGYEKAGFSGRLSFAFQGDALFAVGAREELDDFTDSYTRLDIALQQSVSEIMQVYVNFNNVSNQADAAFFGSEAFPTLQEFFGWTGDLGIRFKF